MEVMPRDHHLGPFTGLSLVFSFVNQTDGGFGQKWNFFLLAKEFVALERIVSSLGEMVAVVSASGLTRY